MVSGKWQLHERFWRHAEGVLTWATFYHVEVETKSKPIILNGPKFGNTLLLKTFCQVLISHRSCCRQRSPHRSNPDRRPANPMLGTTSGAKRRNHDLHRLGRKGLLGRVLRTCGGGVRDPDASSPCLCLVGLQHVIFLRSLKRAKANLSVQPLHARLF